jgi:uncharacterized protein YegP (UPF0339 family)
MPLDSEPRVTFYQDEAGGYRFRVLAANGEIVASSESYTRMGDARKGFETLRGIMVQFVPADTEESDDTDG